MAKQAWAVTSYFDDTREVFVDIIPAADPEGARLELSEFRPCATVSRVEALTDAMAGAASFLQAASMTIARGVDALDKEWQKALAD